MMYDGKNSSVRLECDNDLTNAIIDKFGEEVKIEKAGCNSFIVKTEVSISPTFYSWIFTYGGRIKIFTPQNIADEYCELLKNSLRLAKQ